MRKEMDEYRELNVKEKNPGKLDWAHLKGSSKENENSVSIYLHTVIIIIIIEYKSFFLSEIFTGFK